MTTGRAIVQTVFPGSDAAESLSLVSKEKPRPLPGNAVVRMTASAVNPIDLIYIRDGSLKRFEDKGAVHGSEGVGVVDEIGEGVTSFRVGERVIPLLFWKYYCGRGEGAWQDYVEVAEEDLVPVPDTMSDALATQFVINPWTMYGMLLDLQIPKGHYLLQTAAGSVLGRQCIQLAKHWGIKTINIVRRDELKDELFSIGADEVINSEKEDITMRVKEITNGEGAYAGIDAVGGMLFKVLDLLLHWMAQQTRSQAKLSHGISIGRNPLVRFSALVLCHGAKPSPGHSRGRLLHSLVLGSFCRLRENLGRVFPWLYLYFACSVFSWV